MKTKKGFFLCFIVYRDLCDCSYHATMRNSGKASSPIDSLATISISVDRSPPIEEQYENPNGVSASRGLASTLASTLVLPMLTFKTRCLLFLSNLSVVNLEKYCMDYDVFKRFMLNRGVDLSFACWILAYLSWGYLGVVPPYGGSIGAYNLVWEVLITAYACCEKHESLPTESRFSSRWMVLVLVTAADFIMLASLWRNGQIEFALDTCLYSVAWVTIVALSMLIFQDRSRVWFVVKYSGYAVFVVFGSGFKRDSQHSLPFCLFSP